MEMTIPFERDLYRAVIRYKQEHPGALEERTKQRKEKGEELKCRTNTNLSILRI